MILVMMFNFAAIKLLQGELRVALPEIYNARRTTEVSAGFLGARQILKLFGAATFVFPHLRGRLK